jgi:hypothetical protein
MAETLVNMGKLHGVRCEWCEVKMTCNCWDGNDPDRDGHIMVLCPRCQVTDFLNLLFGDKALRDVLLSKIQEAGRARRGTPAKARPDLKLV